MTQHTPTPWVIKDGYKIYSENVSVAFVSSPFNIDGTFTHIDAMGLDKEANAAFIVRACNAHDALIKALFECHEYLIGYHATEPDESMRRVVGSAIVRSEKALKLARGEV